MAFDFGNPLPLTKENLANLEDIHLEHNDILERYCQEISRNSARDNARSHSAPPCRNDEVVASPRTLPFPYHNDSMFLPTAEQFQYHLSSSTESSTSTRADSISRPQSTTVRGSQHSMTSSTYPARRSLPARLDHLIAARNFSKQRFLRRTSSLGSSSAASSSLLHEDEPAEVPLKHNKKPWIKRILKFFNKKNQQKQYSEGNPPVWYYQYSTNPTSRFEKYYNQQQMVIVS
jgi:hypothetical protein